MPTSPVPGYITKTEAADEYQRSHRQLTRDISDAMRLQDPKVLERCLVRLENGEKLPGAGMTQQRIDELVAEGKGPVWYLDTKWLEKTYGRRGVVRRPAPKTQVTYDNTPAKEGSHAATTAPELIVELKDRIRSLETDKQRLHEMITELGERQKERDKNTQQILRDNHQLVRDLNNLIERVLPTAEGSVAIVKGSHGLPAPAFATPPARPEPSPPVSSDATLVEDTRSAEPASPKRSSHKRGRPKKATTAKQTKKKSAATRATTKTKNAGSSKHKAKRATKSTTSNSSPAPKRKSLLSRLFG